LPWLDTVLFRSSFDFLSGGGEEMHAMNGITTNASIKFKTIKLRTT
jgi:hypothetical protein